MTISHLAGLGDLQSGFGLQGGSYWHLNRTFPGVSLMHSKEQSPPGTSFGLESAQIHCVWLCSVFIWLVPTVGTHKSTSSEPCSSSVQFSCSVVSDPLWPHGPQHHRPPCPSPTPGVYSNSCVSSQWCHPTISSSVVPFSSCLQSFPSSGLFQWVSSLHQVAKVLELQLQYQSFQWIFRTDFL